MTHTFLSKLQSIRLAALCIWDHKGITALSGGFSSSLLSSDGNQQLKLKYLILTCVFNTIMKVLCLVLNQLPQFLENKERDFGGSSLQNIRSGGMVGQRR